MYATPSTIAGEPVMPCPTWNRHRVAGTPLGPGPGITFVRAGSFPAMGTLAGAIGAEIEAVLHEIPGTRSAFSERIGVSKAESWIDYSVLEQALRDENPPQQVTAARFFYKRNWSI